MILRVEGVVGRHLLVGLHVHPEGVVAALDDEEPEGDERKNQEGGRNRLQRILMSKGPLILPSTLREAT